MAKDGLNEEEEKFDVKELTFMWQVIDLVFKIALALYCKLYNFWPTLMREYVYKVEMMGVGGFIKSIVETLLGIQFFVFFLRLLHPKNIEHIYE